MPKATKLIPPDLTRCQAEELQGSFMTLGPRKMVRCEEKPMWILREIEPPPGKARGKMSVCERHREIHARFYPGQAEARPLPARKKRKRA